jgi:hypothetical protein
MRGARDCGALAALAATAFVLLCASALAADGEVAGRVVFDDGTPAASARIVLLPGGYNTTATSAGTFTLTVPPGNYTLRASGGYKTAEVAVVVTEGATTPIVVRIDRGLAQPSGPNLFPVVFLVLSMIAVAFGGFYVNKRMAEKGIDLNRTVMGGVGPRKPFRRRRKKAGGPPPST